jgi:hypothetical protein
MKINNPFSPTSDQRESLWQSLSVATKEVFTS